MKPKEFAALTKDMGLRWQSHHVLGAPFKMPANAKPPVGKDGKPLSIPPMKNLRDNHQQLIDEAAEGGVKYLVCASTPVGTLDEVKTSIEILTKSAEAARKAGLVFCYHNHDAEFKQVDGQVPYELFLSQISPELMKMELDVAWAIKGGYDVATLFRKHPGRVTLWHMKDLSKDHQTIEPVGKGTIDYKTILTGADTAGLQHIFIEHDMPKDAFESITESIKNLKNLLA
jgi:sugar phosphate isomerase/epimerase